jgi:hypothetical protein
MVHYQVVDVGEVSGEVPAETAPEILREEISRTEVLSHVPELQFVKLFFPLETCLFVPAPKLVEFTQHLLEFVSIEQGPLSGDDLPILPRKETIGVESLGLQWHAVGRVWNTIKGPAHVTFTAQDGPL